MLCNHPSFNHIDIIEKWIASETNNERDEEMEVHENVRHADFEEISDGDHCILTNSTRNQVNTSPEIQNLFDDYNAAANLLFEFSRSSKHDREESHCSTVNLDAEMADKTKTITQQGIQTPPLELFEEKQASPLPDEIQNLMKYCQAYGVNAEHDQDANSISVPTSLQYVDSEDHNSEIRSKKDAEPKNKSPNYTEIEPEQEQMQCDDRSQTPAIQDKEFHGMLNEIETTVKVVDQHPQSPETNNSTIFDDSGDKEIDDNLQDSSVAVNSVSQNVEIQSESNYRVSEFMPEHSLQSNSEVIEPTQDEPQSQSSKVPDESDELDQPIVSHTMGSSLPHNNENEIQSAPMETSDGNHQRSISTDLPPIDTTPEVRDVIVNNGTTSLQYGYSGAFRPVGNYLPFKILYEAAQSNLQRPIPLNFWESLNFSTASHVPLTVQETLNVENSSETVAQDVVANTIAASTSATPSTLDPSSTPVLSSNDTFLRLFYGYMPSFIELIRISSSYFSSTNQQWNNNNISQASDCTAESQASADDNLVGHSSTQVFDETPPKEPNTTAEKGTTVISARKSKVSKRGKRPKSLIKIAIKNATKSRQLSELTAAAHIAKKREIKLKNNQAISNSNGIQNEELEEPQPEENWVECVPRKLNFTRKKVKDFETPKRWSKYLRNKHT